jgi:hypothetical protein
MANLTVTVAVTTGTQYVTGSTSNIYTFDGSQPASFTFPWVEDGTVRLEQSGSSNDGHPLIFSTSNSTTLGTMRAGIISSGVTYYLDGSSTESDYTNTTTFNAATTRYIEITPAAATDFYFACWVHGIGMGGIVDITQTTWGALGYGYSNWGGSVSLTGLSMTATLGDLAYAAADDGWGRDAWGDNNWGENETGVTLTGLEMTAGLGAEGWGRSTWGNDTWGEESVLNIEIGEPLTGLEITGSLGTPQLNYDFKLILTESLLTTGSLGSISINDGADHTQGLGGIAITGSLGTPAVIQEVVGLTGIEMTASLATLTIGELKVVPLTGIAGTMSQGSLGTIPDMARGLTGISSTMSLGSLGAIDDMQVGLSGFEITATLNSVVSPLHYKEDTITGSTSYTSVDITGYTAYTKDTHAA